MLVTSSPPYVATKIGHKTTNTLMSNKQGILGIMWSHNNDDSIQSLNNSHHNILIRINPNLNV